MTLIEPIVQSAAEMARWRHDIHRHPETALHEKRTASKVAELLRSFGFDTVEEDVAQTGVVGVLKGDQAGPCIALAAALEGQRLSENNPSLEYKSTYEHCMHAIGHDGEVAMLLGAAKYLASRRQFKGQLICIFYSGYSAGIGGARAMVEEGLLERYSIEEIYRLRSFSQLPPGKIAVSAGPLLGAVAEILVKLKGRIDHVAFPQRAKNPLLAAASIAMCLENLAANTVDPANPLLISVTSLISNGSFDFTPDIVEVKGSARFLNPTIEKWLPMRIDTLVKKLAESHNIQADVSYRLTCPPTINSPAQARFVRRVARELLGNDLVQEIQPLTLVGSDFAYFLQERPGACIAIGNGNHADMMTSTYNFNDDVLPDGASLLARIAEEYLRGRNHP